MCYKIKNDDRFCCVGGTTPDFECCGSAGGLGRCPLARNAGDMARIDDGDDRPRFFRDDAEEIAEKMGLMRAFRVACEWGF